ncbi:MAG TPA: branched-chain amino acid ABC transporter permease [Ilumatobacter sp.]|nr:branched-chain amino acid ABC transporter permease [Ilumatobacter sp.]
MTEIFWDAMVASVGPVAAAYALAAIGLNLQFGYAGLLNFGHVGFMLAGAYGLAITVESGGSFWLGIPIGVLAAVTLGALLGGPTLRLRADYLAIVTISAGEILRLVVRSGWAEPVTNGVFGIRQFANPFFDLNPFEANERYGVGRFVFQGRQLWVVVVGWILVLLATALIWRLVHSPWGRALRGVRDDEDAVRSLGKNVFLLKLQSLMLGGALAGVAGMLLVIEQQNATTDSFLPQVTFFLFVMVILGGAGTLWGPVVGAAAFQFILFFFDGLMSDAQQRGWLGSSINSTDAQQIKLVMVGVGLMLIMTLRPQGVFGKRDEQRVGDT